MNRKAALMAGIAILAMLLASCGQNESPGDTSSEPTDEILDEQTYEEYFASLSVLDEEAYPSERFSMEGTISEVLDQDTLLISKDNQIFSYDLESVQTNMLVEEGWNERLSLNKRIIAYENMDGIHVMSSDGSGERLVYDREPGAIVRDYILSRDGSTLFILLLDGDEYRSILVDSQGNSREIQIGEGEDFEITKPLYLTAYRLYALSETSVELQGEEGDVQASSIDFIYVELATGNHRNLTANAYGDGLEYMGQSSNGNILLRHLRQTTNEDGLWVEETFRTFNINTEYITTSTIEKRDILVFKSINDERDYLTLEYPEEVDYRYPSLVEIRRYVNNEPTTIGTIFTDAPTQMFYYEGYLYFNSNGDTYRVKL